MNLSHNKKWILFLPYFFILAAIIGLMWYRMLRSVEMTDEIHGIASIINIIQGQKPFVTSWDYHTGWCLTAPFYSLFIALNKGSREGIVLFSRILYFLFSISIFGLITYLGYRECKDEAYMAVTGLLSWVPFSIFQLNYNSLSVYLLLLATFLLVYFYNNKQDPKNWMIPGLLFGLACVNYPTLAVLSLATAGSLVFISKKGYTKAIWFLIGVASIGLVFSVWVLWGNSFSAVKAGVDGMLSSPHEMSKGAINAAFFQKTFVDPVNKYIHSNSGIILYLGIQLSLFVIKRCYNFDSNSWHKSLAAGVYILFMIYNGYFYRVRTNAEFFSLSFFLFTLIWVILDCNVNIRSVAPFILIELGFVFTYSLTSDNKNFLFGIKICNAITALTGILALLESTNNIKDKSDAAAIYKKRLICFIVAVMVFIIPGILSSYSYVYRDEQLESLDTRVPSGVYKGLYTTKERSEFVQQAEQFVSGNTNADETLLVVTREPMVYVMSEAKICSPQTWDSQFLYRGNVSAEPILSYFRQTGRTFPDIIVATNSAPTDFFENDAYEIKHFIKENYSLRQTTEMNETKMAIWNRTK